MNILIKITPVFILFVALFMAVPIFAAEIRLDSHKTEINLGEQFLLDVVIHSEESLNAVEGHLIFPHELLSVKEIRYGNSVVIFWIEKPYVKSAGNILFSGISPGGFRGANNKILSVIFEAKNEGMAPVTLNEVKALQNDGLGSQTVLSIRSTAISINPGDNNERKEILVDMESPEDFNPTIEISPNIFDGKYFLIFATQDKISGIANYKIREGLWGKFITADSPYLLKHQSLDRKIYIKAIDMSGNERVVVLNARYRLPWYRQYEILYILLTIVTIGFILKKLLPKLIK